MLSKLFLYSPLFRADVDIFSKTRFVNEQYLHEIKRFTIVYNNTLRYSEEIHSHMNARTSRLGEKHNHCQLVAEK